MKYILYDIQYNEQFFKQFAGLLYFLDIAVKIPDSKLVLPHFRTLPKDNKNMTIKQSEDFGYYPFSDFYDLEKFKNKYNVISIDEFIKLKKDIDMLYSKTERFLDTNKKEILVSGLKINYKDRTEDSYLIVSKINEIFKTKDVVAICGTTNQMPFSNPYYKIYRPHITFKSYLYDEVDSFLKNNNINRYISIHWRQTDFLIVRSSRKDVLKTTEQVVTKCKEIMKQLNIDKVYLATDSKDYNKLKYLNDNLPIFSYKSENKIFSDKYTFAIIESIICAKAEKFYGTQTSLYSVNINGERLVLGKEYKQNFL